MLSWNAVVAALVFLVSQGGLAALQQQPSSGAVNSPQRNVEVVREAFERWAKGGASLLTSWTQEFGGWFTVQGLPLRHT